MELQQIGTPVLSSAASSTKMPIWLLWSIGVLVLATIGGIIYYFSCEDEDECPQIE